MSNPTKPEPLTEAMPLERFTVYWCDGYMGIHISGSSGTWNGAAMKPLEVVPASTLDATRAALELAETERQTCIEANAALTSQLTAATERAAELERIVAVCRDQQAKLDAAQRDRAAAPPAEELTAEECEYAEFAVQSLACDDFHPIAVKLRALAEKASR